MAGAPAGLAPAWPLLAALQPVAWVAEGLVCAPGAAPAAAGPALARLPCPWRALPGPAPPLVVTSAMAGGLYRRSADHAAAPPGVPELVQAPGPGFGPGDHPTTLMCLEALGLLPPGPAVDAGCGSGLLGLAWARLGRGPVLALDADPQAVAQARASARLSGLAGRVRVERRALEALAPGALAGRVLLANAPAPAQAALRRAAAGGPPRAALLSGLRPGEAGPLARAWRALGLRPASRARRGRWERLVLVGGEG